MKRTAIYLLALLYSATSGAQATNEIMIFRPGKGLNNGSDQGSSNGGKDAWIFEQNPAEVNDTSYMLYSMPVSNCNNTHAWSLIRFDLQGLPQQVDSVFVGFTHYSHTDYCYSHCEADWYFYKITSDWEENTVTYNNAPLTGDSFYGPVHITFPNSFGTREYDITGQYIRWINGTDVNRGFAMKSPNVGCNNACVGFYVYSSDDTAVDSRPYLKIYYPKTNAVRSLDREIGAFPNPADQELLIRSSGNHISRVNLYDVSGRPVWQGAFNTGSLSVPTSELPSGVYLLKISSGDQAAFRRILIQHR